MANKILCPECDHKAFRHKGGLAWQLEHVHGAEVAEPESQVEELDRVQSRPLSHQASKNLVSLKVGWSSGAGYRT